MVYTIKNDYLDVSINEIGAELVSVKDKKQNEYIYQPTDLWIGQAKNLFPNIGIQKNNSTVIRGKTYPMYQHGFAKSCKFNMLNHSSDNISFSLENSVITEKYIPYKFRFIINFSLQKNTLIQTYKVTNLDSDDMYFGIGCHTGFNSDKQSYVKFPCEKITEVCRKDMKLMTGKTKIINLNNSKFLVSSDNFNDGAHIFKDFSKKEVILVNPLIKTSIGFSFNDFNYMTLWTTPDAQSFICMMPWCGLPDSEDSDGEFEHKKGNVCIKSQQNFVANQFFTFNNLN